MSNPFPGMNPYLETHWGDVHHSLIQYCRDALIGDLPDDLLARVEERVFVERDDERVRSIVPDALIVEWHPDRSEPADIREGGVAVAEARTFVCHEEEITEGYIEIRDRDGGRVVTVIEFLSPANKAGGEGTKKYRQKQTEVLQTECSLVAIDLVRSGRRVLSLPEHMIPEEWRHDSLCCIRAGWDRVKFDLYSLPLRERLKALPIPLRQHEPPVLLDLQAIVEQAFRNGRYDRMDYANDPLPPLRDDEAGWADELLKLAGKR